jgi:hypothetical protein
MTHNPAQPMPDTVTPWPCGIGDHDGCIGQAQLRRTAPLSFCPCECHQNLKPTPDTEGEWRVLETITRDLSVGWIDPITKDSDHDNLILSRRAA